MWKRIRHLLTHDAEAERARQERVRVEDAIDALTNDESATWMAIVKATLFHQGTPNGNVDPLLARLARGESHGWDEADYEVVGDEVEVSFLGASARVPRTALVDHLRRIRTLWDASGR